MQTLTLIKNGKKGYKAINEQNSKQLTAFGRSAYSAAKSFVKKNSISNEIYVRFSKI